MSDESQDDRTEAASERRLQQAWERGEIALGRDAVAAASIAGGMAAILGLAQPLRDSLVALLRQNFSAVAHSGAPVTSGAEMHVAMLAGIICGSAALSAVVASIAQTKGGVWMDQVMPDLTRLGGGRILKTFTKDGLIELALAIAKVGVIAALVAGNWRVRFMALGSLTDAPSTSLLDGAATWLVPLGNKVALALVLLAGMDVAVTRLRYASRMKMTREEAKREHKEDEGDPMLRGKRKRKHRELSKNRIVKEMPRADALVVNPTHVAVAIRYRKEDGAPRVIAKGKGKLAEIMRELAHEHGIPIVENIPLARLLHKRVKVGREIPADTFKAVAAILAFVYRLTGRRMGAKAA